MKALTLTQPWATLAAHGKKKIETRSWGTAYRGEMAIHAAKGWPWDSKSICFEYPFHKNLIECGFHSNKHILLKMPLAVVLSKFNLVDVVKVEKVIAIDSPARNGYVFINDKYELTFDEFSFGDYTPGRFMWFMEDMELFPEPIPAKGFQRIWNWNPS